MPSFEPDQNAQGALTFYNASGTKITSGTLDSHPMAAYFAGSGGATPNTPSSPSGVIKATAWAFKPVSATPSGWSGDSLTASTTIGAIATAGYPAPLTGSTNAIAKGIASDFSMDDFLGEYPVGSVGGQAADIYEIRVTTGNGAEYYRADIQVDVANNAWTAVYPNPVATTTAVSGPTTGTVGTAVTYTAAVTAATGTPTGTVQFKVDGVNFGSPVSVATAASSGAQYTPTNTTPHTITAVYTSNDLNSYTSSIDSAGQTIIASSVQSSSTPPSGGGSSTSPSPTTTPTPTPSPTAKPKPRTATISAKPTSIKKGKTTKIFGAVKPVAGGTATLQKLVGKKWTKVTTATIKSQKLPNGKKAVGYVFTFKSAKKATVSLRVVVAAVKGFLSKTSSTIRVKVK